ncbi:MAG: glycosyltransferase family 4 protein [Planctomycetota bacterium]
MSGYRILYHHRIRADDGQAVHVRELIEALRAEGHEVLECALVQKTSASQAGDRSTAGAKPTVAAPAAPSFWQKLSLPRIAVEALEIAYGRQGARMIERHARSFRPDFIYERHALHCDSGLRASRRLGIPLLLEVNSPFSDEMAKLGLLRFPRIARATERRVLAGADIVFAVTGVLRDMLIERGARAERTLVVQNGAHPERYEADTVAAGRALRTRLGIAPTDFVLGFVGYMRPWHRLDLAAEMLAREEFAGLHLLLVGDGPARAAVAARAEALGVSARVHFVGAVPGRAVPEHVTAFDAALVPAINPYASPLKLFDSLAAAVPTIVPDQPNLREIVRDGVNGLLFQPEDAASLRAALERLYRDRDGARAIGRRGRQELLDLDLTWRGNASRVVAAFESLTERSRSPR